jgi:hypothetical protein
MFLKRNPLSLLLWSLFGLGLLCVIGFSALILSPAKSTFGSLPDPNGYDALVQASAKLSRPDSESEQPTIEELASLVAKNQTALTEVKSRLSLPSAVPVRMSEAWLRGHSQELLNFKAAAKALNAEATLLARRGDTNGGLLVAFDALRFSEAILRGGVLIDYLVGSACELMAVRQMTNLLSGLNLEACRQARTMLEDCESRRDSLAELLQREKEWSWNTFGVLRRVEMMIQTRSLRPGKELEFLFPDSGEEYRNRVSETRLAIVLFASRAYEFERGGKPRQINDLVPTYLRIPPTNLVTGKVFDIP